MDKKITDSIIYIGVDDKDIDLFESQYVATMPSIDALKCIKVTNCYVWFYDDEKECEVKAKSLQYWLP